MILTYLPLFLPRLSRCAPEGSPAIAGSRACTRGHSHFPIQQPIPVEKQCELANFVPPGIKAAAYRSQTIACSSRTAKFTVKGKNTKGRKRGEAFTKIKVLY